MGFAQNIRELAERFSKMENSILTEEATKMSLILPFFQILGYDVFNPMEVCPEFTADVGIKKGEKVDYAILINGEPIILVEAKSINKKLDRHSSQLFRYFVTTPAKFAVLTNGINYKVYTDLEEPNKMDKDPFMDFDLSDITDAQIEQIEKFHKKNLNVDEILNAASILKYNTLFKKFIDQQLNNPSSDFVRFFLQPFYKGAKTQAVIEKFRPILKDALKEYINETVNSRIKFALDSASIPSDCERIATDAEWDAITLVKDILKDTLNTNEICHKQTGSYLAILYKNNTRKWICRINLYSSQKALILPDESKKELKYPLQSVSDISLYSADVISVAKRYLEPATPDRSIKCLHTKWGVYEMPDPYAVNLHRGPRDDLRNLENNL